MPAAPKIQAPVQTLTRSVFSGKARANSSRRPLCISRRVPIPPGIRKASMSGRSSSRNGCLLVHHRIAVRMLQDVLQRRSGTIEPLH